MSTPGLHIVLVSVHGLIRGVEPEYGRDADTGGQIRYVIELARSLAEHRRVARVDILTRRIVDSTVSSVYAKDNEQIAEKAFIIRLPCGVDSYLRKETLWPYLSRFVDSARQYIISATRGPLLFHSHYADSGLIALELAKQFHAPHIFTAHSLGKPKQQRLHEAGVPRKEIERRLNMSTRIACEEQVMRHADLVITSSDWELRKQYSLYEGFDSWHSMVNPPGIDTHAFHPPGSNENFAGVKTQLNLLLKDLHKPLILAVSRPDARKNLTTLVRAFMNESKLRDKANLLIVSGGSEQNTADDLHPNQSLSELRSLMYSEGFEASMALLECLPSKQIAELYKFAYCSRGVFVNPALTEPFGLTLLEATATGLPVVATKDGGPSDIIERCRNGLLINPLDTREIADTLLYFLSNTDFWETCSINGPLLLQQHYSWSRHTETYLKCVEPLLSSNSEKKCISLPSIFAYGV